MEHLESLLSLAANAAILLFEFMGVGIIICSGITGFIKYVRRSPDTRIYLAKGLAMGLEFKLGSEILRTVVVRQWQEIGIVAGIIALRAARLDLLCPYLLQGFGKLLGLFHHGKAVLVLMLPVDKMEYRRLPGHKL